MSNLCSVCDNQCKSMCIECSGCLSWTHFRCARMPKTLQQNWDCKRISFFCKACAFHRGSYNFSAALNRISSFLSNKDSLANLDDIARQETLLLETYGARLLPNFSPPPNLVGREDEVSRRICEKLFSVALLQHSPREATADGNCFYHALSLGLFGKEKFSVNLRLATTLEILQNRDYYDCNMSGYHDKIESAWVFVPEHLQVLKAASDIGSYAGMIHFYAASAALKIPIMSYKPPGSVRDKQFQAYNRKVVGRGVRSKDPVVSLLWTSTTSKLPLHINHFNLFQQIHPTDPPVIVDLTEHCLSQSVALAEEKISKLEERDDGCLDRQEAPPTVAGTGSDDGIAVTAPGNVVLSDDEKLDDSDADYSFGTGSDDDIDVTAPRNVVRSDDEKLDDSDADYSFGTGSDDDIDVTAPGNVVRSDDEKLDDSDADYSFGSTHDLSQSPLRKVSTPSSTEHQSENDAFSDGPVEIPELMELEENVTSEEESIGSDSSHVVPVSVITFGGAMLQSGDYAAHKNANAVQMDSPPPEMAGVSTGVSKKEQGAEIMSEVDISSPSNEQPPLEDDFVDSEAPGLKKLTKRKFFSQAEVVSLLAAAKPADLLQKAPPGKKENVYFLLDDRKNFSQRQGGGGGDYTDDCGAWGGRQSLFVYYRLISGRHDLLHKRRKGFCKRIREHSGYTYKLVKPQPREEEMIILVRRFYRSKSSPEYCRKISWVKNSPFPVALYEYVGEFKGHLPHGNSKCLQSNYIKTDREMLKREQNILQFVSPKKAYTSIRSKPSDEDLTSVPRNPKQLRNQKYFARRSAALDPPSTNIADNYQAVISKVDTSEFVQATHNEKTASFSAILHTEEQFLDMVRFCFEGHTVLGIDKTYNLGDIFVSVTVFKNLSVLKTDTMEHPVFFGPFFLHTKSTAQTYSIFWSYLSSRAPESSKLFYGTDNERAIHSSFARAFPGATHVLCYNHIKRNFKDNLQKRGMPVEKRVAAVNLLSELVMSQDQSEFHIRRDALVRHCSQYCPGAVSYLQGRFLDDVFEKVWRPSKSAPSISLFTNNNSETANLMLKTEAEWKKRSVADLVRRLHGLVDSMYGDVQRAITGTGPYILDKKFSEFSINPYRWISLPVSERKKHFKRFMKLRPESRPNLVVSTDGRLSASNPPKSSGRKKGQARRKKN